MKKNSNAIILVIFAVIVVLSIALFYTLYSRNAGTPEQYEVSGGPPGRSARSKELMKKQGKLTYSEYLELIYKE